MHTTYLTFFSAILLFSSVNFAFANEMEDSEKLFKQKCTLCHAIDKKKLGPAVNAMSHDAAALQQAITKGKKMMPAYEKKLSTAQISSLVKFLLAKQ